MNKSLIIKILSFVLLFTGAYLIGTGAAFLAETVSASAEGELGIEFPGRRAGSHRQCDHGRAGPI